MPITADRDSSHLAGEYLVAAELYRRGYSVAMTLGKVKAIDLFVAPPAHRRIRRTTMRRRLFLES